MVPNAIRTTAAASGAPPKGQSGVGVSGVRPSEALCFKLVTNAALSGERRRVVGGKRTVVGDDRPRCEAAPSASAGFLEKGEMSFERDVKQSKEPSRTLLEPRLPAAPIRPCVSARTSRKTSPETKKPSGRPLGNFRPACPAKAAGLTQGSFVP